MDAKLRQKGKMKTKSNRNRVYPKHDGITIAKIERTQASRECAQETFEANFALTLKDFLK